jgi:hypothetical protein
MDSTIMQKGALFTREAHMALLELKALVDNTTEKIHAAQLEAVGLAVGHSQNEDPLKTLRLASEIFLSPNFEATVSQAREKMGTAVTHYLGTGTRPAHRTAHT